LPKFAGLKLLLKNNLLLLILFGLFVITGALVISATAREDLHVYFNSFVPDLKPGQQHLLNTFFIYFTYLGDGIFILITILLLFFVNVRFALTAGIAYALSSGVAQIFKQFIFQDFPRPHLHFESHFPSTKLKFIEGIQLLAQNSFPSGHTTAAFALFLSVALISNNRLVKLLCFFTAICVGMSRVYLSQHFFEDIYGGAIIGGCLAILSCYFFYFASFSGKFNRLDTSLVRMLFAPKQNV
jgi:membrane-associated phospholipid phosphatase